MQPVDGTSPWSILLVVQPWQKWELPPIWVSLWGGFKYSNLVESSQEQKEVHLSHANVYTPLLLFSTLECAKIRKILGLVGTKECIFPSLVFRSRRIILTSASNNNQSKSLGQRKMNTQHGALKPNQLKFGKAVSDWKWVGGSTPRLSSGRACARPGPRTSCSQGSACKPRSTAVKVSTYLGHKTQTSPLLSVPHVKGLSTGCRYLLQPVAHQSNLGLSNMGGVKLSLPPFIHVHVNRKIMDKLKKLTIWLEGLCLGVRREVEVEERRWGLFCRAESRRPCLQQLTFSEHNARNYRSKRCQ